MKLNNANFSTEIETGFIVKFEEGYVVLIYDESGGVDYDFNEDILCATSLDYREAAEDTAESLAQELDNQKYEIIEIRSNKNIWIVK